MTDHIITERAGETGAINLIRFNRPEKKNAITRAMYSAMARALIEGERDDGVRVHVLLGTPGVFTSGNDMQDFMAVAMGGAGGTEVFDFLGSLANTAKPVVSGVDGLAIGIGTTIHMHCDLTFATPGSRFHTPFTDLALVPEAASSLLAPAAMGHQKAFALLAAGIPFSGEEAERAGLIYKTVSAEELEPAVFAAADHLAQKPPQALAISRRLVRQDPAPVIARMREEAEHFSNQLKSAEALAAFQAFMARKK